MATQISNPERAVEAKIPSTMRAVVYRGINDMRVETVPVPTIGPGELLIKVATCGICGTDLKKIHMGSHSAPRIFGHEMAGVVAVQIGAERRYDGPMGKSDRAFTFGLLHGFGFAGALAEVGLPQHDIPLALFLFNLGVEAGQLVFVAALLALRWAILRFFPRISLAAARAISNWAAPGNTRFPCTM